MGEGTFHIPGAAWKHPFEEPLDQVKGPSGRPSWGSLIKMAPMIIRMLNYTRKRRANGFDPININTQQSPGPYQGVPLGGIGAGSIGRGWRGDFRRWQLRPGFIESAPVWADQFSLFVQPENADARANANANASVRVLFPGSPEANRLSSWAWGLPSEGCTYHALFPRAWTTYDEPLPGVRLACRQLSPVIAHNYQESSYPAAEFRWRIENISDTPLTVGLMLTFQNGIGAPNDDQGGHTNQVFQQPATDEDSADPAGITGILMRHAYRQAQILDPANETPTARSLFEDALSFAIATRADSTCEVTYREIFTTTGDGADVWLDFAADGRLDNMRSLRPSAVGEVTGAALAVTLKLEPGEVREVPFSLAWDMPRIRSGYGTPYLRRYTRFYGTDGDAARRLACDALICADQWEAQVEAWQAPILQDDSLPMWYRSALFNELYYLVDGGTIWASPEDGSCPDPEMGRFAYLESHDYRMYNTYDVHFYASFALVQLWPKLELALQRDIAEATLQEGDELFTEVYSGKEVPRKVTGAVPHDIGWPDEDPWIKVNGYFVHDVNDWKDLNPKFVLQVMRDYVATGDRQFLEDTWEAVQAAIERAWRFDRDGDGLIENDGFPDQTYDVWTVKGPSAYTGGLWLACLSAAAYLSEVLEKPDLTHAYKVMLSHGMKAYEARLWNGRYFNYDASRSPQHDSIMADQMAGQWYARACGLKPIVNPVHARSALSTVFDWNVQRFQDGLMGAVNGMRPGGSVDRTSMQSQEVWTGTTYALAAAMIQEGMREAAFATAWGIYHMTYQNTGYWFQTPEAWDEKGNYRAIAYMRPLAIWAMQWAIEHTPA